MGGVIKALEEGNLRKLSLRQGECGQRFKQAADEASQHERVNSQSRS